MSAARLAARITPLVALSGACALAYQVTWQREFRLVFGASTAASAAVIAIFIAGLGGGALVLGRRADRHPRPLALYANLELGVALFAATTPALFAAIRALYVAIGGSAVLGSAGANAIRLVLAALVLAVPTFMMGGSLPAAVCAVERASDTGRKDVAVLYGVNTLGAVAGALVTTFFALEVFGTRLTTWTACLVNLLVAVIARSMARSFPVPADAAISVADASAAPEETTPLPPAFPLVAALLTGATFFLMELVWYRMLGPLLGGSVFTFGLILALALAGVGIGSLVHGLRAADRPATVSAFALTCLLEAVAIALPFALGDRIALLALRLRALGGFGFAGHVLGWTVVASIVILPAAIVAGAQFPVLVGLVGRGRARVGEELGRIYAWNTVGSAVGAIGGGFGLLPALSATGAWRLAALVLLVLGAAAAVVGRAGARARGQIAPLVAQAALTLLAIGLLRAEGPTAVWRHSPIGVGRVDPALLATPNGEHASANAQRRSIVWEADGVESSVAISLDDSTSFIVNGKADGNARGDAATQVGLGMLAALLHPRPAHALVIGLGTGETAGWLAAAPEVVHVDAVELEPAVVEVARRSSALNHDALSNPKLSLVIGDAREVVLTRRDRYDVIASEPPNPYRAGVASLYTREFYASVVRRLTDDGVFVQFVQGYEIDPRTVRTVIATLASAFPEVEIWEAKSQDLLLVARRRPAPYDVGAVRARLATEPYASAFRNAWRVTDAEGIFAHFIAGAPFARAVLEAEGDALNTDDATIAEFGFARGAVQRGFDIGKLKSLVHARGEHLPRTDPPLEPVRLADERASQALCDWEASSAAVLADPPEHVLRTRAKVAYQAGDFARALGLWTRQPAPPRGLAEIAMVAELEAEGRHPDAVLAIDALRPLAPVEADVVLARHHLRSGRGPDAVLALISALHAYRTDPWPWPALMDRAFGLALDLAQTGPDAAARIWEATSRPFAGAVQERRRLDLLRSLATVIGPSGPCSEAFAPFEPFPVWELEALRQRARCYAAKSDPLAARARADVDAWLAADGMRFELGLEPPARR